MRHLYFTRYRRGPWYQIPVGIYRLKLTLGEAHPRSVDGVELRVQDIPSPFDDWPAATPQVFQGRRARCVCRACGTLARVNPKNHREWACPSCNASTHSPSIFFVPEWEYTKAKLPTMMGEGGILRHENGPDCDVCGSITIRAGDFFKCLNCGKSMAAPEGKSSAPEGKPSGPHEGGSNDQFKNRK